MATASLLLPLPTEIHVIIANELRAEDYGALRLSCKSLDDRLFPYFAKKFFTSKHFFRNYYSLSVLRDISDSRISPYVKTVVLGTELIPSKLYRFSNNASVDDCLQAYADQRSLCASGWDRDLLSVAFSRLQNLEGVIVQEFEGNCDEDPLDPDSARRRTIAGVKAGYGLKSLMEKFGIRNLVAFNQDEFDEEEVGIECVQTILASAARAKKPLKTFKIAYYDRGFFALACDALHIPFFQKNEIPPILATIEDLHLDVLQKRLTPWPLVTGAGSVYDTVECDTFPLRKFLGYTGQLRRLTLRQLNHQEPKDGFWDWMAANPTAKYKGPGDAARLTTPPPVALPHLRELHLGQMRVPIKPLIGLIGKIAPTIRKLIFRQIMLYNISADPDHNGLPRNLWKELFRVLIESHLDLAEIEVETSFSKRLSDRYTPLDGEDGHPHSGQLMIWQRDIHYQASEEVDIEMELSEDMHTPDKEERPMAQPYSENDSEDSDDEYNSEDLEDDIYQAMAETDAVYDQIEAGYYGAMYDDYEEWFPAHDPPDHFLWYVWSKTLFSAVQANTCRWS